MHCVFVCVYTCSLTCAHSERVIVSVNPTTAVCVSVCSAAVGPVS